MNRKIVSLLALVAPVFISAQVPVIADSLNAQTTDTVELQTIDQEIPAVSISEDDVKDETGNVSTSAAYSRDPFSSAAAFVFSSARFRIRGYENENFITYLNGIPVNDLEDGGTSWGQWGGLNNVFYKRENNVGLQPTTFAYGGTGGTFSLDTRASKQRKQFQVSYANTNRNYRHRLMATYSTGMLKHGWAVSASVSRRWAKEGYIAGTFYDGYSYFLSVEKFFGKQHSLSLTMLGAPVTDGKSSAATQEMYDLAGTNYYNPNWGMQNGQKRNAVVGRSHQPLIILNHEWKMNSHENMVTAAGFSFGKRERTGIDFYNAANPHPDYYRNLPSYIEDSIQHDLVELQFRTNEALRQVDWAGFYDANAMSYDSVNNANGIAGNTVYGKRGRYIVQNRIEDVRKFNLSSVYNNAINSHIALTTGLTYQFERTENYVKVEDLLGADFYVDVNQFAERDFPDSTSVAQNDLNRPNRILHEGDKYGYDYFITTHKGGLWAQSVFKYKKVDFFVAGQFSVTSFWRKGVTRYGLAPDNSEGKSAANIFINGGVKAGLTYKVDGKNNLFLNGAYENRAPFTDDAFVSPRTRNSLVANLKSESNYSFELGYSLKTAIFKLKADLYYTQFNNQTKTTRFYHDDLRTFVNYSLTGINTRHFGAELGLEAKIWRGFSATAAASIGRYTYTSRPTATITYDNDPAYSSTEKVYQKNFNVAGTPQLATTVGINYRAPQFWFVNVNFNYYDYMWLNFNPARRTETGVDLVDPASTNYANIVYQQRLKGQFTMDLSLGYSWLLNAQFKNLKKRYFLVFNASVSNVTNNKSFITGGYEQLRYDYFEKNTNKFPPKYYYAYGTTYFVSVAFRMQ